MIGSRKAKQEENPYGKNFPNEAQVVILGDMNAVYQEFGVAKMPDQIAELHRVCPDAARLERFFDQRLLDARD